MNPIQCVEIWWGKMGEKGIEVDLFARGRVRKGVEKNILMTFSVVLGGGNQSTFYGVGVKQLAVGASGGRITAQRGSITSYSLLLWD